MSKSDKALRNALKKIYQGGGLSLKDNELCRLVGVKVGQEWIANDGQLYKIEDSLKVKNGSTWKMVDLETYVDLLSGQLKLKEED